ncbi:MAG TPA: CocE/NonD family hydrolase [Candidatus Eremiobacteraceae bacterium]|nr:CocE/NonD family hydrolase [Candidatus Eremiobacteraceae bacterium]
MERASERREWLQGASRALRKGLAVLLAAALSPAWARLPGEKTTPAGIPRSTARYVKMRDGVEIAVSLYLPKDLKPNERVPVLMRTTRYWREPQKSALLKMLLDLHIVRGSLLTAPEVQYFNQRRFAVLLVDARGTGASGGHRELEFSPAEVADMGEVAAWAAAQPWSNGNVGTFGISYEGNTAELAAVPNQPAIRAVMPLYDTFDNTEDEGERGVALKSLLSEWFDVVAALDRDDVCGGMEVKGLRCWMVRRMIPGVRPVDGDSQRKHLKELVAQHQQNQYYKDELSKLEFYDDTLTTEAGKFRLADISPSGLRTQIEASKVPMMVWEGWLDGSDSDGSLIRYRTFSNPQVVVIGPLSHGGDFKVDPFVTKHKPPEPTTQEQFKVEADFFDRTLRSGSSEPIESSIRYYTTGEGQWHTTKTWPPSGFAAERLYFGNDHTLSPSAPTDTGASDSYTVDFTASSGKQTRWHTGFSGSDVVYPDRADADKKLLLYTSAPLQSDLEITGSPVLSLEMSSTTSDGAIHAYLEDVSPEGRVTYVDEGVFRVINRKEVDPKSLPYEPLGPAHSFLRADAEPLVPGTPTTIRFSLYATSVWLRQNHRIRVALAGADADVFRRYPAEGTPVWKVYREASRASFIELPVRGTVEVR